MYKYIKVNGTGFVQNEETGNTIPYHGKAKAYHPWPDDKWFLRDEFLGWLELSNSQRQKIKEKGKMITEFIDPNCISLGSLQAMQNLMTENKSPVQQATECCKKGNNPMRSIETYANATVTAPKSEESIQREYLLDRLMSAHYPKTREMVKVFNLHIDNSPKTYKELIEAIKKGKYTLDEKICRRVDENVNDGDDEDDAMFISGGNPFYGIIWDGPQPDHKGYEAAIKDISKMYQAAKDTIMVSDAAEGLKAIQKFEAWMPK